jgi:ribosomal protein S18 acetylase RimI-like enzyme
MTIPSDGVFRLPDALVKRGYALREEQDSDTPFQLNLFASTRAEELAAVPWSGEQKAAFLSQQFSAQRHHYRTQLDHCEFLMLEHKDAPIGRLYLQTGEANLHIVDIALSPERRGTGIGGAIIAQIIDRATSMGKGVSLFVEPHNPARRLYERLGFVPIGEGEIYLEMELPFDRA